ncbi:Transcription factor HHO2, partial [Cucurbita argyrosperma subsp. argyrosperma]|uniref:Transcription factor HHO2-like n=2 Tax=Cucurbita TaxID=3660 RepID=A0A6J1G296_CUCMO
MDFPDNVVDIRVGMDLRHYVDALDQERRKILVFQRELPLCVELVTRAIDSCRQQLSGVLSESSEHTSSDGPVLEEFIPVRKDSGDPNFEQSKPDINEVGPLDWLKSAQLWNQTSDPPVVEDVAKKPPSAVVEEEKKGVGGGFQPFQEKNPSETEAAAVVGKTVCCSPVMEATASSTVETVSKGSGGNSQREEKESQTQRKRRRRWSSELHRRFVRALQRLGGPQVATPKQIRELMKVDDLTNDEVKSHLQKYRLHARRPTNSAMHDSAVQKFVVVGSMWEPPPPPPKYMAMTTGQVTPVARVVQRQKTAEGGKGRPIGGMVQLNSPPASYSTLTATTSPAKA